MTSTNMSSKIKPFLLTPSGKDYLWGGNRLKTEFNKTPSLFSLGPIGSLKDYRL